MAEGGISPDFHITKGEVIKRVSGIILTAAGLVGCKSIDQQVVQRAEAVGSQDRFGEASFDGDAAEAYRKAYVDYLIQHDGKSEMEAAKIAENLYQENMPTSGWPSSNTLWVTGEGVTAFDTSTALWNYVNDDNWETNFSQELRNAFGNDGKVLIAGSYEEMSGVLTGLSELEVPAKSVRQEGGGVKVIEGPSAYADVGIGE
jgi:hypothetical protein